MPIAQDDLEARLKKAFPQADIIIDDLAGDGDHYRATIIDQSFEGVSRVKQHKMVYDALGESVGGEIHALSLITKTKA